MGRCRIGNSSLTVKSTVVRVRQPVRVQVAGVPPWEQAGHGAQFVTVTAALEYALGAFDAHTTAASAVLWADAGAVSLYPQA